MKNRWQGHHSDYLRKISGLQIKANFNSFIQPLFLLQSGVLVNHLQWSLVFWRSCEVNLLPLDLDKNTSFFHKEICLGSKRCPNYLIFFTLQSSVDFTPPISSGSWKVEFVLWAGSFLADSAKQYPTPTQGVGLGLCSSKEGDAKMQPPWVGLGGGPQKPSFFMGPLGAPTPISGKGWKKWGVEKMGSGKNGEWKKWGVEKMGSGKNGEWGPNPFQPLPTHQIKMVSV